MKRITVTLTYDQANTIYNVLEWAFDYDNHVDAEQRKYHAYIRRIRTKFYNAIDDYIKQI